MGGTVVSYRGGKGMTRSRFSEFGGAVRIKGNTLHRIRSCVLAHCTYCLVTRGKSPQGRRVTFTRYCFTIRAEGRRLVRREVSCVREARTEKGLERSRGELSRGVCRHKMSSTKFNHVQSGKSRTLFNKFAAGRVGRHLNMRSGEPLTSFLPALAVTTGGLTARVAGCGIRRGSLRKRSTVAIRRIRGGASIESVLKREKVGPRSLPTSRSVGGLRHEIGERRGGLTRRSKGLAGRWCEDIGLLGGGAEYCVCAHISATV